MQKPIFAEPLPEHLKCSICHQLFDKPVQLPRCQHVFCRGCIQGWLMNGASGCPLCRKPSLIEELQKAAVVEECIENLLVCCPSGAAAKKPGSSDYYVLAKDAEFIYCNHRMPKKDLKKHLTSCSHAKNSAAGSKGTSAKYETEISKLRNQIEDLQLDLRRKTNQCQSLQEDTMPRRITIRDLFLVTFDLVRGLPRDSLITIESEAFRIITYFDSDILEPFNVIFQYPSTFSVDRNRLYNCIFAVIKNESIYNDSHPGCSAYAAFLVNALRYQHFTAKQTACIERYWEGYIRETYDSL